jgi:hypothetical protein
MPCTIRPRHWRSVRLTDPHPLVAASIRLLQRFDSAKHRWPPNGCLCVSVRPDLRDRALRVMDALLKTYESRGCRVEVCSVESPREGGPQSETTVPSRPEARVAWAKRSSS